MALIASDSGGGDFKPVPQGVHTGRCFRVIDLGTQPKQFQGKITGKARKVMLTWELFGEDEEGNPLVMEAGNAAGKPLSIGKRYTLSLGKKADLRSHLESWRGRAFTDEELKGFDLKNILGVYGLINVKHDVQPNITYANVASISPIPKQMRAALPAGVNALQYFDVTEPDMALFETFSEKLKATISACEEWQKKDANTAAQKSAHQDGGGIADMDDDLPDF